MSKSKTNKSEKRASGSLKRVVLAIRRRSLHGVVTRRRKVSVVQYAGYHAVYPGQAMLEKRNNDKSKNTVTWADIIPDQTHKTGNWKITVEYEAV